LKKSKAKFSGLSTIFDVADKLEFSGIRKISLSSSFFDENYLVILDTIESLIEELRDNANL
jgi:hypothetical protein